MNVHSPLRFDETTAAFLRMRLDSMAQKLSIPVFTRYWLGQDPDCIVIALENSRTNPTHGVKFVISSLLFEYSDPSVDFKILQYLDHKFEEYLFSQLPDREKSGELRKEYIGTNEIFL